MRTIRTASIALVALALLLGSVVAATGSSLETQLPISQVTGTLTVEPQMPGGSWEVQDRIFQYRDFPISATGLTFSDPRLDGELQSNWNWDIHGSGSQPVPSWGTMRITTDENAWEGTFTGIKHGDGAPVAIRAFLIGEGLYDGLCATLDLSANGTATGDTWMVDGVIHPDPM